MIDDIVHQWIKESENDGPYSAVRHLASAVFPSTDKYKYMAMLTAHFDETGHGKDPNCRYLGIAGCLGTAARWVDVEQKWIARLDVDNLPYFHMNEYTQSTKAFAGWDKPEYAEKRDSLYGDLWDIILEARPIVAGCFVKLEDYRTVLTPELQDDFRDAYYLCYAQCLAFIASVINEPKFGNPEEVVTIFDNKDGFKGYAFDIHESLMLSLPTLGIHIPEEKFPLPVFRDMRIIRPIQIADIIVYEAYKELDRREKAVPGTTPRFGFKQLEKVIGSNSHKGIPALGSDYSPLIYLNKEKLEDFKAHTGGNLTGIGLTQDEKRNRDKKRRKRI